MSYLRTTRELVQEETAVLLLELVSRFVAALREPMPEQAVDDDVDVGQLGGTSLLCSLNSLNRDPYNCSP